MRRRGLLWGCAALVVAGSAGLRPTSGERAWSRVLLAQSVSVALQVPPAGQTAERAMRGGDTHEWQLDVAAGEYVELSIEPAETALAVEATMPGGAVVLKSAAPEVTPGLRGRHVVSLVATRSGIHTVRITTQHSNAPRFRYVLGLVARQSASDEDRRRVAAHTLWRDAARLSADESPDALRTAVPKYEEALRILREIGDRVGEAWTLSSISNLYSLLNDTKAGRAAAERALALWTGLDRQREVGEALSQLGFFAYLDFDHATARSYYEQALSRHRAAHDRLAEAVTLTRVGWIHYATGDSRGAIDIAEQTLPMWREVGDVPGESTALNDLGRAYDDLGDMPQALDAYSRAIALRPKDVDPRGAGSALNRLGIAYLHVAEWQRALDAFHEGLPLAQRTNDTRNEVTLLVNLGSAYNRLGDSAEARRVLAPALAKARDVRMRIGEANALYQLGIAALRDGDAAQARDFLQQAVAIQIDIRNPRGQMSALRMLASAQLALNVPLDALKSITASQDHAATIGTPKAGARIAASVYEALGDDHNARSAYQAALEWGQQTRQRDLQANALLGLGAFQARHGLYAEGRDLMREGLEIFESLRSGLIDPELRMTYLGNSLRPYRAYIDVLMELHRQVPTGHFAAEAFLTAERGRARGLLDLLASSDVDVRQGVDASLVERERAIHWNLNAKAAIQTRLLTGKPDPSRLQAVEREIADLSNELRELSTRIRRESPANVALVQPQPLGVDDVKPLVGAETVLLEFALGDERSWLFALTGTGLETFMLPSRLTIEDAARDVYQLLTARQPVDGETAAARHARIRRSDAELWQRSNVLGEMILGPVRSKLTTEWQRRRLAIVPAGALEYVPFGALPMSSGESPRRGVEMTLAAAHEIVTLPSASSLAVLRQQSARRAQATKAVAIFADPVFERDDPRVARARQSREGTNRLAEPESRDLAVGDAYAARPASVRALEPFRTRAARGALARLPFTRAEAAAVTALAPRTSVLEATDFEANLSLATSGRLADYRVVHFATHGLINTVQPELSGLALSLVDAQGRRQDGFLRLNTIYNLRLSADLVVLSACQSALGKEMAGEGLLGLTRGFMYAGAPRVVASLWQVDDVATAEFMKRFYDGLLRRRLRPAAALRAAQREIGSDPRWAAPYYWAAFVLQGDWQ